MEVEEPVPELLEVPTKAVEVELTVAVRARVAAFDFEGRSDGRSMRTILTHVAPRHIILVHGSPKVRAGRDAAGEH
jgi:Cft2 family RNA processing exonuclease